MSITDSFNISELRRYQKDIAKYRRVSPSTMAELARIMRKGGTSSDRARDTMIKSNLRLVCFFARKYAHLSIPLIDCIDEGNIGLVKAVEKFDPQKMVKFSTFAVPIIKQHILKAINAKGQMIRISNFQTKKIARLHSL